MNSYIPYMCLTISLDGSWTPKGTGILPLLCHCFHTGCGALSAFCPMDTGGSFPGGNR